MTLEPKTAYTLAEVAEQLSVCTATVRAYVAKGLLPVWRVGRLVRVRHRDLVLFQQYDLPSVGASKPWPEQRPGYRRPQKAKAS